ncbi:g1640 [Coccomyxa elongata]
MFAAKILVERLQDAGLIEVPQWVPFLAARTNCGHVKEFEYVIVSQNVVTPDGTISAAVQIKDGRIAAVKAINGEASRANLTHAAFLLTGLTSILDYNDLVVGPGLIDTHVHMNQPGRTSWEGMETATSAAAVGGITTVIDMPLNSDPTTTTVALVEKKIGATRGEIKVDMGVWGGLVPENAGDHSMLRGMLDAGALGFKSFMIPSGIDDFPSVNETHIKAVLPFLKSAGVPYYLHAELKPSDDSPGECSGDEADPRMHASWLATRPPSMENNAIKLLIRALEENKTEARPGFRIHIAHLADAGSMADIQAAKEKGLPISVETCPHYLNFAAEDVPEGATEYKCAPPLRPRANQERLWEFVMDGRIDSIGTDHSPSPPDMKHLEEGDFSKAWGGISGLQYGLPGTWEGLRKRGAGPEVLTKLWSTFPAQLAGLQHKKGALKAGLDADIVVWDPEALADTSEEALQHRHKLTPYTGLPLHGRVAATFVRGHQVFSAAAKKPLAPQVCGKPVLRHKL